MPVNIKGNQVNSLFGLLSQASRRFGNSIALVSENRKFTFRELYEKAEHLSAFLRQLGVGPGINVSLYLPNSVEMVICYFAIWRLGAVAVPINYFWKEEEIGYVIRDSDTEYLIVSKERKSISAGFKNYAKLRYVLIAEDLLSKISNNFITSYFPIKEYQPALIIYTSGTTGKPKGAMLSHYNLLSNVSSCDATLGFSRRDCVPCILPLFHSFALTVCMLTPIAVGAKIVLLDAMKGPKYIFRQMLKEKVTVLVGIPAFFSLMVEAKLPIFLPPWLMRFFMPIRVAISGASALPVDVWRRFKEKFGVPLLEGYGLTEASPVVSLNPLNAPRVGSVGLPIKDVEVKIVDEQGRDCPAGRVGQILVKGPNVMVGYYKKLSETKKVIVNGWLYTGDLGYKDQDGYLYIVGRKKEVIIVRGLNVYPREIEDIINSLEQVKECAVVGVKHRTKGEVPIAFVVPKDGCFLEPKEVLEYLKTKLANYKVPARVIILDDLPKNALRKVQKDRLISMVTSFDT